MLRLRARRACSLSTLTGPQDFKADLRYRASAAAALCNGVASAAVLRVALRGHASVMGVAGGGAGSYLYHGLMVSKAPSKTSW